MLRGEWYFSCSFTGIRTKIAPFSPIIVSKALLPPRLEWRRSRRKQMSLRIQNFTGENVCRTLFWLFTHRSQLNFTIAEIKRPNTSPRNWKSLCYLPGNELIKTETPSPSPYENESATAYRGYQGKYDQGIVPSWRQAHPAHPFLSFSFYFIFFTGRYSWRGITAGDQRSVACYCRWYWGEDECQTH